MSSVTFSVVIVMIVVVAVAVVVVVVVVIVVVVVVVVKVTIHHMITWIITSTQWSFHHHITPTPTDHQP